jgi:hypothetical protein
MFEFLGDPWPRLRASSVAEFIESPKGNNFIRFLNQYVFVNHTCRLKYSQILFELRQEIKKKAGKTYRGLFEQEHDRNVMLRFLETEVIGNAYMASEDFATFCLSFREPLEDVPSAVTRTSSGDIWKFFRAATSASPSYFQRLWVYEDPSTFRVSDYERRLIDTVEQHNVAFLSYLVKQLAKFRDSYSTLYNKYKHGFPLFLGGRASAANICNECLNLVLVASEETDPLGRPRAFILGEHAIDLAMKLHSISMHALEALLRSRLNWLRFNGWRNPPTVVYGQNPLGREDWEIYQRTVKLMVPEPLRTWPLQAKIVPKDTLSVAELFSWIHSDEAKAHWLTAVPERFFFFRE